MIDGFVLGERIHGGNMGGIYRVASMRDGGTDFPMLLKMPYSRRGDGGAGMLAFETEVNVLPLLAGVHVPRFVAAGAVTKEPYLVLEYIEGRLLDDIMGDRVLPAEEVARIGAAIADALHSIHTQGAIHLDLKPQNIIVRVSGEAALIDFGMAHHSAAPDLLAEEHRFAAGSAPYVAPEQVIGVRSDARSDLFALGVILYEMTTGELPFGSPQTLAGTRDRLWLEPAPPRSRVASVPPWLQEVILHCLEPAPEDRYQTAALIALDLRHPEQVPLSERSQRSKPASVVRQAGRWWRMRPGRIGGRRPSNAAHARVIMVAVDTMHPDDPRHPAIQDATRQLLSVATDFRLLCVSVVRGEPVGGEDRGIHFEHRVRLRHWIEPLGVARGRLSLHVIEALNPAGSLLEFAHHNNVDLIVIGAPGPDEHAMAWWRSVASGVTSNARCSVHVVRLP